jgi:hypothetical protein
MPVKKSWSLTVINTKMFELKRMSSKRNKKQELNLKQKVKDETFIFILFSF